MVGYHKHDNMSTRQKLIAGCLSGVATRFLTQPLDIIKLRTQVQGLQKGKRKGKTITKTAERILSEEGLAAFWHGHIIGQVHSILAVSSQFLVYEILTQYTGKYEWANDYKYKPYVRFVCGVFAGCASATLVLPLEVIRVRQMLVKEQYQSLLKGGMAVYKYGGVLAFYEGLSASLLQMGPQVGFSFVVFSYCQPMILHMLQPDTNEATSGDRAMNRYKPQNLLIASTIAGSLAGLVSKTLTYPLDLTKRRLQLGSHKVSSKYHVPSTASNLIRCHSLTDCLTKTVEKEGFRGLFRGWTVTIWKAQVTSIMAFTSYELLCFAIREYNNKV
ncbi:mitochondrial carrier protein domain-containing protein [Phthorimaea operculella]|nr:mitochondrial carrier protein domain-containing protein [Phthorimaea operculella]